MIYAVGCNADHSDFSRRATQKRILLDELVWVSVMGLEPSGPWDRSAAHAFLDVARIPMRVAAVSKKGWPMVVSLWFLRLDDVLWCATTRSARLTTMLAENPKCGFEVSVEQPPYRGLRGQAEVTLNFECGPQILRALIDRYLGNADSSLAQWLLSRTDEEVALHLDIVKCQSWDYTERMTKS